MESFRLFDTLWLFVPLFLLSALAIVPAVLAQRKGYNFWLFYLFGVVVWLITMAVVLFLPDKTGAASKNNQAAFKTCRSCGEDNPIANRSCERCGARFS